MRSFAPVSLVCASFVSGCYASHTREEEMPPPVVEPPVCPEESGSPGVIVEVMSVSDVYVEAGTRDFAVLDFRVREIAGHDTEIAEFPYRIAALMGSLITPAGEPVFSQIWLDMHERRALFGPDDLPADATSSAEGRLWDSNLLRAHEEFNFTLLLDVAPSAAGTYEITIGSGCHFTPRMWFVPEDGPTIPMPVELIGNNTPVTVRVTITPRS